MILKRENILRNIVNIDIDEDTFVATQLLKRKGQIYLNNYKIVSNLSNLKESKECPVVITLPTQSLLFRGFLVNSTFLKDQRDQKKATIAFLQRQNLPLKLDDCFWYTFRLNNHLNLVAAKKEIIERTLAQMSESGFDVVGLIPSFSALYNLFIHNYGIQERFLLLNMRNLSSDLLIYENKRIWVYPLSIGRRNFKGDLEGYNIFIQELNRTFNTHYLQNPSNIPKKNSLYLSGTTYSQEFLSSLKGTFSHYEIMILEPLKRIIPLEETLPNHPEIMGLSIGLGLTFLEVPNSLSINLLKEKIKKEKISSRLNLLKKTARYAGALIIFFLGLLNIKLFKDLLKQHSIFRTTNFEVSTLLPEAEVLKAQKQELQKTKDFLRQKLNQQSLYLKALAVVSESKSPFIEIKEFEAEAKEGKLEVFLSGVTFDYININEFLINLRKYKDISDVKVVASTFPDTEKVTGTVDFKLRFEIK